MASNWQLRQKILTGLICVLTIGLMTAYFTGVSECASQYKFSYVTHGGQETTFWAIVRKGMLDAAELLGVDAVMISPKHGASLTDQVDNLKAAIAARPDGIIVTIVHDTMFDEPIKEALAKGIPVICANSDDSEGAEGNARLSYIGQNNEQAGYLLAKEMSQYFPGPDKTHVLLVLEWPGSGWCEQRALGTEKFLKEYGASWERLDSGKTIDVQESRILAYFQSHPETNVFICGAEAHIAAARAARKLGHKPGEITIGGYNLMPPILVEVEKGYVQVTIDQQAYLQGYLPVIQLYLMKKYGFSAWDVSTGYAFLEKGDLGWLIELSKQRIR